MRTSFWAFLFGASFLFACTSSDLKEEVATQEPEDVEEENPIILEDDTALFYAVEHTSSSGINESVYGACQLAQESDYVIIAEITGDPIYKRACKDGMPQDLQGLQTHAEVPVKVLTHLHGQDTSEVSLLLYSDNTTNPKAGEMVLAMVAVQPEGHMVLSGVVLNTANQFDSSRDPEVGVDLPPTLGDLRSLLEDSKASPTLHCSQETLDRHLTQAEHLDLIFRTDDPPVCGGVIDEGNTPNGR